LLIAVTSAPLLAIHLLAAVKFSQMKSKNYSGSNTHIFSMIYPWIIVLIAAMLLTFNLVDTEKLKIQFVILTMIVPVIVANVWFCVKNKGLHRRVS
jgi:hypothetical protein